MMMLSIVIPCFNEERNIPIILERFSSVINRDDVEVILVNNGSLDSSDEVLEKLIPKYPFAKTLKIEVNQGYGNGILQGLRSAEGKYIGWTHADMQTDPYDVMKALSIIADYGVDSIFVKGSRKKRPIFDQLFTTGMSIFETLYLGAWLWDINAQPNIFSKKFFESWKNPPNDFSLDLFALYMARKNRIKICRFDVEFPERIHGSSSWNTGVKAKWKFIRRTIDFSVRLKRGL